jgi:CRISPR-associated protein Csb3
MSHTPPIRIPVDVTNPGQFFACCGLLELAARCWSGTTAAFDSDGFIIKPSDASASLRALIEAFQRSKLRVGDEADTDAETADDDDDAGGLASPMSLDTPFNLTLDWWADKALKPWAGSMNAQLIFGAMREAIDPGSADPLNDLRVVHDPPDPSKPKQKTKKREPFYFDSRRGGNAKSLDVGFAPDAFSMTSAACSAVESLCVVGLQRFRPMPTDRPRVFVYRAWTVPLPPSAAAAAACGLLPGVGGDLYRFENAFRTDRRNHKGFLPATRITEGDTP